ncbi:MAG: branched-chain amino acid transport system ATP-binding protein [Streptosporangiaceae bacterium]|jgi:branched-chain amino acid transport system ATP-binding protein|nr:branched-chain amino acid transport system ATP-binding protein [Streptosporangiaceae bacterium]
MPTSSDRPVPAGTPDAQAAGQPVVAAPPGAPAAGPPQRPPAVLRLDDVAAGYGAAPIVSGVSISVGSGEVVSVIGPNGAGKSTLLKTVTGRLPVMAGTITFGDRDVTNMRGNRLARMGLGFVPQTRDVFDTLTVAENLEMGGYLLSKSQIAARVDTVLSVFPALAGMQSRTASKLSGGERKMLAMARVLMLEPSVLVLDEPTSNLSPDLSRSVLRDQVRRLADAGTAVLLVEQKAFEALGVSDWAYILVAGRVEIAGPAGDILARPDIREVFLGRSSNADEAAGG